MKEEEIDLTEKMVTIPFDSPIAIVYDQESGTLQMESKQINPGSHHINIRAVFTPAAIQELLVSLKQIENALKLAQERPAETNILDKTNLL